MNPFDDDEEFDLIVDQIVTNTIQATQLIIQRIQNEEAEPSNPRPRGPNKDRGREDGHDKLVADYFSDNPVYNDEDFKRRFRMSRRLFVRIVSDLEREFDCFKQQWDARGVKGFSPLQKCTSAIRAKSRQRSRKKNEQTTVLRWLREEEDWIAADNGSSLKCAIMDITVLCCEVLQMLSKLDNMSKVKDRVRRGSEPLITFNLMPSDELRFRRELIRHILSRCISS
ncbi:hypothetical protein OSB04_004665 [Centaurea solstitialis]|uniref:Uncharacterized protein n=1 Tax=Centaurea solstitialis TaxID=347529 RepID=A0AA38WP06_9ASTR|nr:hypothetical protein OSB04_004665 [Centaurea solstitialis]